MKNKKQIIGLVVLLGICIIWSAVNYLNPHKEEKNRKENIESLTAKLRSMTDTEHPKIGIALIIDNSDTILLNNNESYPLHSVMKLHQAIAVADFMSKMKLPLDSAVAVKSHELIKGTYSPMLGNLTDSVTSMPLDSLIYYSLVYSDNNASEAMSRQLLSPETVSDYIKEYGIKDFNIEYSEGEMEADHNRANKNLTTPLSAAILINLLFTENLIEKRYGGFITSALYKCQTGTNRIPRPLTAPGVKVAHKTGTGFKNASGITPEINDVAFVSFPSGKHYSLAVFLKNSDKSLEENERIIADISKTVFEYLNK